MTRLWEITKAFFFFFFFCSETNTVCENIHPGAKYMYRKVKPTMKRLGGGPWSLLFGKGFHTFIHIPVFLLFRAFCYPNALLFLIVSAVLSISFFFLTPVTHSQLYGNPSEFEEVFLFVFIWFLRHVIFVDWELSVSSKGYLTLRENRKCYYG